MEEGAGSSWLWDSLQVLLQAPGSTLGPYLSHFSCRRI